MIFRRAAERVEACGPGPLEPVLQAPAIGLDQADQLRVLAMAPGQGDREQPGPGAEPDLELAGHGIDSVPNLLSW